MASLLPVDGVLAEVTEVAPSPSKDYWQLKVTFDEVIIRWWKISLRADAKIAPSEVRETYEDFLDDYKGQSDIQLVFGNNALNYVIRLAQGQVDYLPRLSDQLLMRIIQYLALDDIARLALVSKQFNQLCRSDELWKRIYHDTTKHQATSEELWILASEIGWKQLYFTNKLQLQVQLHRLKKKHPKEIKNKPAEAS